MTAPVITRRGNDEPAANEQHECLSRRDLAVMGATLAGGGVNPVTRSRVVDASASRYALAVMATAGLYETSGEWLYDIGFPGKSGIGGGIVTVSLRRGHQTTPPAEGRDTGVDREYRYARSMGLPSHSPAR